MEKNIQKLTVFLKERGLIVNDLEKATRILEENTLIFPTDTLLGLLGNAFNKEVVDKIFKLKKRDEKKPLLLLVDDFNKIKNFLEIKPFHSFFIEEWPAPLTLIFKVKKEFVRDLAYLHRGTNKIAVRIPDNELLLELLEKIDFPLVAPSANIQSMKPASNLKEAFDYFGTNVFYWEFDEIKNEEPSTIIDISELPFKIVRRGAFKKFFYCFTFFGNKNISAKHKYTFEITKEDYLTERGDCIIGVDGFSNKEFQIKTEEITNSKKISYSLVCEDVADRGVGYKVVVSNPSSVSFVVRRSTFIDNRTSIIKSNKTALLLNRYLIFKLKEGKKAFFLVKDIEINKILIDFFVLLKDEDLTFLPKRLKRRFSIDKDKDVWCLDKIKILKDEKMAQYLELIKQYLFKEDLTKTFGFILSKIRNFNWFSKKLELILFFRPVFFNKSDISTVINKFGENFLKESEKIFEKKSISLSFTLFRKDFFDKINDSCILVSKNDYLLKNAKKRGATTYGIKEKYFVDFKIV